MPHSSVSLIIIDASFDEPEMGDLHGPGGGDKRLILAWQAVTIVCHLLLW